MMKRAEQAESKRPQIGLLKGLGVTLKTMLTRPTTQQYPKQKPALAPRTRGVIALMEEELHGLHALAPASAPTGASTSTPTRRRGSRPRTAVGARTRNILDRFAIDFALCMYCGICVEVCPFDALFWSPEFEYSTLTIEGSCDHEKEQLRKWMDTVPPPPELEYGAELPRAPRPRPRGRGGWRERHRNGRSACHGRGRRTLAVDPAS